MVLFKAIYCNQIKNYVVGLVEFHEEPVVFISAADISNTCNYSR